MLKTDLHLIKKHLFGDTLTDVERNRFDLQLNQDAEFQKNLTAYQNTVRLIRRTARQEIRETLQQFEKTGIFSKNEEKMPFTFSILRGGNRKVWSSAAASVALIICLGIWYFQEPNVTFEKIAENNQYQTYNYLNLATVRSKQIPPKTTAQTPFDADIAYLTARYGADNAQKLSSAMLDLKDKRFVQAAVTLAELAFVAENDSMRLSRGDAFLGANDVDKAIADYNVVVQNQTTPYKDIRMIAEWHLALAYLKKGDQNESRRRINIIVQTANHNFQREAKEVLEKW